jgi:5'-nucleotidase
VSPKVIAVDVDDVCANLIGEWISRYNSQWGDNLLPENITDWELTKCVKPECGQRIYEILHEPDLYDNVYPMPGARNAVYELLAQGHRVVYVTACVQGTMDRKLDWLLRWDLLTKKNYRTDFIVAGDKSLVMANYLFDDRPLNVETFRWGRGVLVSRPHNASSKHPLRVNSLADAPLFLATHEALVA